MGRFAPIDRREDLRAVMKRGSSSRRPGVAAYVLARADGSEVRLGCAIRGRGAVDRNRIRRRVREALAACDPSGLDVVVQADPRAESLGFQELVRMLEEAIEGARA